MRVAFLLRRDAINKPGGDLSQVKHYIEAGRTITSDHSIAFSGEIITDLSANLSTFDLVHLTNLDRPIDTYFQYKWARSLKKPIVFSTIHHSYRDISRYERLARGGTMGMVSGKLSFHSMELFRSAIRSLKDPDLRLPTLKSFYLGLNAMQCEILTGVDGILALNSREVRTLEEDFPNVNFAPISVLPNGAELRPAPQEHIRDIDVLVVGRIESRKNQIAILQSLERLGIRGLFIGKMNPNHERYCKEFLRQIENSRSIYAGEKSSKETLALMSRSKVHVSASWFEVSSLVDIEAYLMGCRIVSSCRGGTDETLGQNALYVEPNNEAQIDDIIERALSRSASTNHCYQLNIPTWAEIGAELGMIYRATLNAKR